MNREEVLQARGASSSSSHSVVGARDWARAGARGTLPGNLSRDVISKMGKQSGYPQVYSTGCTFWDEDANAPIEDDMHFMVAHEVLDHEISDAAVDDWVKLPVDHSLNNTKAEWMQEVGMHGDGHDVCMFGVWADAAVYHTRDSLNLILFNVISGCYQQRFWLGAFSKRSQCRCGCKGMCTWDRMWATLAWMFGICQTGTYPEYRDDGTRFDQSSRVGDQQRAKWAKEGRKTKVRGGVGQVRGDWSFHKTVLRMCGWRGEGALKRCCFKCLANFTNFPYTAVDFMAPWRPTLLTHRMYKEMVLGAGLCMSGVFNIPGVRLQHITPDLMHTSCLGIVPYLLGCIIWELVYIEMGATQKNPDDALSQFVVFIRIASKRMGQGGFPINVLTPTIIAKNSNQGCRKP